MVGLIYCREYRQARTIDDCIVIDPPFSLCFDRCPGRRWWTLTEVQERERESCVGRGPVAMELDHRGNGHLDASSCLAETCVCLLRRPVDRGVFTCPVVLWLARNVSARSRQTITYYCILLLRNACLRVCCFCSNASIHQYGNQGACNCCRPVG
jgi:hypothetical protein